MILRQVADNRKIFRDMGMNKWRETQMSNLKKGMRIRIYSPNGRPLEAGGEETFLTLSDAFLKNGLWAVEVKTM
ncbi:MAG: hypothetical protein RBT16_10750 [Desulfococcus multivorans]|jgi:hypothetical protein|nr:hypothetical protein [Desulfococcus multivorans]